MGSSDLLRSVALVFSGKKSSISVSLGALVASIENCNAGLNYEGNMLIQAIKTLRNSLLQVRIDLGTPHVTETQVFLVYLCSSFPRLKFILRPLKSENGFHKLLRFHTYSFVPTGEEIFCLSIPIKYAQIFDLTGQAEVTCSS
jgi:hypothetical protein